MENFAITKLVKFFICITMYVDGRWAEVIVGDNKISGSIITTLKRVCEIMG